MVERLSAQIQTDPENINLYREICGHLRTLKRFEEALDFVRKARQQPLGKGDTTFEKMEQGFLVAAMDQRIAGLKKKLEENPDDEALKAELAEVQKQEHDIKLENAKQMVERYPNDFNYRYELGMLLFDDGNLDEAIMQFQISQRSPKVRLQSLLGLGRAFTQGKKYDLAVDQLETAKKESKIMNESKKEIIYELGTAYELMGKAEQAFNEYKEIYSADISYRDVAKKINDYYNNK
jgi:tetratricopeptide (TPR) repeat protein